MITKLDIFDVVEYDCISHVSILLQHPPTLIATTVTRTVMEPAHRALTVPAAAAAAPGTGSAGAR